MVPFLVTPVLPLLPVLPKCDLPDTTLKLLTTHNYADSLDSTRNLNILDPNARDPDTYRSHSPTEIFEIITQASYMF